MIANICVSKCDENIYDSCVGSYSTTGIGMNLFQKFITQLKDATFKINGQFKPEFKLYIQSGAVAQMVERSLSM